MLLLFLSLSAFIERNIAWLSCFVYLFCPCKCECCVLYIVNVKLRDLKTLWTFIFLGVHFKYNNGLILATIAQIFLSRIVSNCISGNLGKWHHEEEVMLLFVPV